MYIYIYGGNRSASPKPIRDYGIHKYQRSKLNWAIMHEFFVVALNGDGNVIN